MTYNIGVANLSRTWCSTSLWSDLPGFYFHVVQHITIDLNPNVPQGCYGLIEK